MAGTTQPNDRFKDQRNVFVKRIIGGIDAHLKNNLDTLVVKGYYGILDLVGFVERESVADITDGTYLPRLFHIDFEINVASEEELNYGVNHALRTQRIFSIIPVNALYKPENNGIIKYKKLDNYIYCWIDVGTTNPKILTDFCKQLETDIRATKMMYY